MSAAVSYRRIKGASGRGRWVGFNRSSLWLADDHLLLVELRGWTERYHRFYFRDIEAFVMRQSSERLVKNVLLGLAMAACLGLSVALQTSEWLVGWLVIASVFAAGMIVNTLQGRGCEVRIKTRVQSRLLPSLNRWPRALRVIQVLAGPIRQAQADLPPPGSTVPVPDRVLPAQAVEAKKEKPIGVGIHACHWLLLVASWLTLLDLTLQWWLREFWVVAFSIATGLTLLVSLVWVAGKHQARRWAAGLRVFAWSQAAVLVASMIGGYALYLTLAVGARAADEVELARLLYTIDLDKKPVVKLYYQIQLGFYAALSLAGLVLYAMIPSMKPKVSKGASDG